MVASSFIKEQSRNSKSARQGVSMIFHRNVAGAGATWIVARSLGRRATA
jgi:hypothetical protein